jgi:hypothetical protein
MSNVAQASALPGILRECAYLVRWERLTQQFKAV